MSSGPHPREAQTGAHFVPQALTAEGTSHVFCVPGGHKDPFLTPMTHTPGLTTVTSFDVPLEPNLPEMPG